MHPTIIIADDHPLILKGLQDFLIEKEFNVLDSATDGEAALKLITMHQPDIAVLDIRMPKMTGLEIAKVCKTKGLKTKIVLITFEKDESLYYQSKELDVYGYILKEFALVEIEKCIKSIILNKPYISPELEKHLVIDPTPRKELELLTETERKILKLIAQNKTALEIAELQHISIRTVQKHKSNMVKKLNLKHKQNSLLIWAREHHHLIS